MHDIEHLQQIEKTLSKLILEHNKIREELELLERTTQEEKPFSQRGIAVLQSFRSLTLVEHHYKEDQELLAWMVEQNENVDTDIISCIREEHKALESKLSKLDKNIKTISSDSPSVQVRDLVNDLIDFIQCYREHIDLEEKFIFLIVDGIISNKKSKLYIN